MKSAPVVLLGSKGMLARAFCEELNRRGRDFVGHDLPETDVTKAADVGRAIADGTTLVLNCAAWTNVDGAEKDEATATAVNGAAVGLMADRCRSLGAVLVNYGTDYVFSGRATSPYRVNEPREPLNAYGRSKAVGEELLERSGARFLHLRTSWLYAPWGNNFVRTIAKLLREKPSIKVVDDQRGRPTSAEHLARTTLALLDCGTTGTVHATDSGECTWYDFAREIGRLTGALGMVEPCASAEFPRPAKRPAYSVLDISGTERLVGHMPDWKANLADVVARLEK